MNDRARRPWWKRKRWIAAIVLWLAIAYPLSLGPAMYCWGRGWVSNNHFLLLYPTPIQNYLFHDYHRWWIDLAFLHEYGKDFGTLIQGSLPAPPPPPDPTINRKHWSPAETDQDKS